LILFDLTTLAVTGQNGSGQNGTNKMVSSDKMVWTKWLQRFL